MNKENFLEDDDETLVILEQPQTEVFWNQSCTLTILQTGCNDGLVTISPQALPELIRHLQAKWRNYCEAHDLPLVTDSPATRPPPPTPTLPPKKRMSAP